MVLNYLHKKYTQCLYIYHKPITLFSESSSIIKSDEIHLNEILKYLIGK